MDAAYQPPPGQARQGRETRQGQGLFGPFPLARDDYDPAGKAPGHDPAAAARGWEAGSPPALARLGCWAGADETSDQPAEKQLLETGGRAVAARPIQRLVQRVGAAAQTGPAREAPPGGSAGPKLYGSADATGVALRQEARVGRAGQQAAGRAQPRWACLGCVFPQPQTDAEGPPGRDDEAPPSVASVASMDALGPRLRQDALRRGLALALQVGRLIDGAEGLARMGRLCFPTALPIVDFYQALEEAAPGLGALLGRTEHPDCKKRLRRWARRLRNDPVESLMAQARRAGAETAHAPGVEKERGCFVRTVERRQEGPFRRQGFLIGAGGIEAGGKTGRGARGTQSGLCWGAPGAENVRARRCLHSRRHLADFWKDRRHPHAPRNASLALAA